jgi:hypothetical protein
MPPPDARESDGDASVRNDTGSDRDGNDASVTPPDAPTEASSPDAPDSPASAEACATTCTDGAQRCSPTGIPQACASVGGCFVWRDLAACPGKEVCCNGTCIVDDPLLPSTCHETPPLGYDYYVDFRSSEDAGTFHAMPYDDASDAPSTDLDGSADALGTAEHPFRTITHALQAASRDLAKSSSRVIRIYVARGVYDTKLGEIFPLIIPGGVSLEGAGAVRTTIAGIGHYWLAARGANDIQDYFGTMVLGDTALSTRVSGFTIVPGEVIRPARMYRGIQCDMGTRDPAGSDAGQNVPNTRLDDVVVGPGYELTVVMTSAAMGKPGCNMQLTHSSIIGGKTGIYAMTGEDPAMRTALVLGDGTPDGGNTLRNQVTEDGYGFAVDLRSASSFTATYNTFLQGNWAVNINKNLEPPFEFLHVKFNHNRIDQFDYRGLSIYGAAIVVDELSDNNFSNCTGFRGDWLGKGFAAALELNGSSDASFPVVKRARNNVFFRNDKGIYLAGSSAYDPSFAQSDFGLDETDPGGNVFHCNGPIVGNGGIGALVLDLETTTGPVQFDYFQGNLWDSYPPTQGVFDMTTAWPVADILVWTITTKVNIKSGGLAPGDVKVDCK